MDQLKIAALALSEYKEILAVEYLQNKRIFGKQASIEEMASFRSKIKPEEPPKKEEKKEEEKKSEESGKEESK